VLDKTPAHRKLVLDQAASRDITIIGIDNAQWLVDELAKLPPDHRLFDCLVIDETSKLKDPKAKRGKKLFSIASRFRNRWGLTGTPRPNSLMDLFNQAKILTAGRLWGPSFYKWQKAHFYPLDRQGYRWAVLPGHEEPILADIATISIALGEGEMPDLPEISILVEPVTLPEDAREIYDDMELRLFAELEERDVLAKSAAVATGKCSQIANGFLYGEGGNQDANAIHSEKEDWLAELVDSLQGEPCILVYEYREDLEMIRRLFPGTPWLGAGISDRDASLAITRWNKGELPLLALHPASGGHGLNLQHGGSRMAWLAPTWSAELWEQTIARIHRPGQDRHVMVHVCVAEGTVDELKRLRVISKLGAQAAFEAYLAGKHASAPAWGAMAAGAWAAASPGRPLHP
jgi:hypothetical protein